MIKELEKLLNKKTPTIGENIKQIANAPYMGKITEHDKQVVSRIGYYLAGGHYDDPRDIIE